MSSSILRNGILIFMLQLGLYSGAQINLDNNVSFQSTKELENHKIISMAEDGFGFIYIATNKQVFRFDGIVLNRLCSGMFVEILTHKADSCLYFIHRRGIYRFNWITGKIEDIRIENVNNVTGNLLSAVFRNDDELLLGYDNGLIIFDKNELTHTFKPITNKLGTNTTFLSLLIDAENPSKLWMGSRRAGLFEYDLDAHTHKQIIFDRVPNDLKDASNTITEIYQYGEKLYLGTWYGGILNYTPESGSYKQFFVQNFEGDQVEGAQDHIYKILPLSADRLYFSSTKGAMLYDLIEERELARFNSDDGILSYSNAPQFVDSQNRLWIGRERGIRLIDTLRSNVEVLRNPYRDNKGWYIPRKAILADNDSMILFCTFSGKGLYVYDLEEKTWQVIPPENPARDQQFRGYDLEVDETGAFILEQSKLYRYNFGDKTLKPVQIKSDSLKGELIYMARPSRNKLIIMTRYDGLYEVDINSGNVSPYMPNLYNMFPDLASYSGDELYLDKGGRLWMAWKNHLLLTMTNGEILNLSPHLNDGDDILNINYITESDTFVYVALPSGVYEIDKTQLPEIVVEKISDRDYGVIAADQSNDLWFIRDGLFNLENGKTSIVEFGINDGLHDPGRYGYEYVNTLGKDIIVGSRGQFSIINPKSIQKNNEIPDPYIKQITINGLDHKTDSSYYVVKSLKLKPNENNLTIGFSALAFTKPESIKFRYKLEGAEDQWNLVQPNQRNVTYSNLDGGNYNFMLEASNNNLIWSNTKSLKLDIAIPFYKNKWFLSLILFLGIFTIYTQYRKRLLKLKNEAFISEQLLGLEKQALRAQMNPHFVFNALNSIQHLITEGEEKKSILYLNKFSKLLRGILDNSQSTRHTLSHELEILDNYLELEFLRLGEQFTYELNIPESLFDERIEMQGLLFQPFIENAIHHGLAPKSSGGNLKVDFENHEHYIRCIIEDDGIGRVKAREIASKRYHKSRGIGIVEKRIKLMSKSHDPDAIKIIDLYTETGESKGTRVELKIPINGTK
ncbi:MAG: histidine kinase [Flavobacteriaceae bacterium]|nr:histidine kinase [Flavobacteriaceae bacterium]